jgi:hypothetical protein
MTEIQFLAQLLLETYVPEEMKLKIIKRIVDVEASKPVLTTNAPVITYIYPCNHTYPTMWGGTTAPRCTKCGEQAPYWYSYTVTSGDITVGSDGAQGGCNSNTAYVSGNAVNSSYTGNTHTLMASQMPSHSHTSLRSVK